MENEQLSVASWYRVMLYASPPMWTKVLMNCGLRCRIKDDRVEIAGCKDRANLDEQRGAAHERSSSSNKTVATYSAVQSPQARQDRQGAMPEGPRLCITAQHSVGEGKEETRFQDIGQNEDQSPTYNVDSPFFWYRPLDGHLFSPTVKLEILVDPSCGEACKSVQPDLRMTCG